MRVLVAEDSPTGRALLARLLATLGMDATVAADGTEALAALAARRFDILVTDCHMPEVDGFALARAVRDAERRTATRLPIVALTANDDAAETARCLASGIDLVLAKPARREQLAAAFAALLHTPAPPVAAEAPSHARVAANAPLDLTALAALIGDDDRAELRAVLADYLATVDDTVRRARDAVGAHDDASLGEAAHAGKGSALNVCAAPLAEAWKRLEAAARAGERATIVQGFAQVETALIALRAYEIA